MDRIIDFFRLNFSSFTVELISAIAGWVITLIFAQLITVRIKRRQFYHDTALFFDTLQRLREKGKIDSHVVKVVVQSYSEIFLRNFISDRWYSKINLPFTDNAKVDSTQCWVCGEETVKLSGKCKDCELDCCTWDKLELKGYARIRAKIEELE